MSSPLRLLPPRRLPLLVLLGLAVALATLPAADSVQAQDGSGPSVTAGPVITSSPEERRHLRQGREAITVAVTFSEVVTVTGEPRVRLTMGERRRWARYSGGSDSATLTFTYTVQGNDQDDDGIGIRENALKLRGGTIKDADDNAANLSLPALADQAGHQVDGSPPPAITAGPTITSSPASGDAYGQGETITLTVTFSEAVTVNDDPRVRLDVGERKRYARYSGGGDSATLTFTYTVKKVDADEDGISIPRNAVQRNDGAIIDAGGRSARLKHPALDAQAGHKVKGSPEEPAIGQPQFAAERAALSVPENTPKGIRVGDAVAAIAAPESEGPFTYTLSGADAGAFRIDAATGQLRFLKTPDFEKPADAASATPANAAGNNQYAVTVSVSDGKDSQGDTETTPAIDDSINVTVTVTDVDERGRLALSPTRPRLGAAVTATVSDPDGQRGAPAWKWERSRGSHVVERHPGRDLGQLHANRSGRRSVPARDRHLHRRIRHGQGSAGHRQRGDAGAYAERPERHDHRRQGDVPDLRSGDAPLRRRLPGGAG